jgi:hypothetical protein
LGPVQINKEKEHSVQWPPIIGGLLLVAGIAVFLNSKKGP